MAEWTNIFDLGECAVEVYQYGDLVAPEDYEGVGIASVAVVDGVVTVTALEGMEIRGLDFRVTPSFDTQERDVRVVSVQMVFSDSGYIALYGAGTWTDGSENWETSVPLSYEDYPVSPYLPDPAVVTPGGPWDAAGIVAGSGG